MVKLRQVRRDSSLDSSPEYYAISILAPFEKSTKNCGNFVKYVINIGLLRYFEIIPSFWSLALEPLNRNPLVGIDFLM